MRLADFIEQHHGRILEAWEGIAATLPPFVDGRVASADLREHVGRMLDAMVADMRSRARVALSDPSVGVPDVGGASEHGLARHAAGLSLIAMAAEFRALRAVVSRMWLGSDFVRTAQALDDLVRFNEALDQLTASAVLAFSQAVERDRALLMGIVAHDLRGPLHTASMALHILAQRHPAAREDAALGQAKRSLARMLPMVDDLLGVAAAGMRAQLPVRPQAMDLKALVQEILAEAAGEFPEHAFALEAVESISGFWDRARLGQLISNLVRNAAAHGVASGTIRVSLHREGEEVVLAVHNTGAVIPEHERQSLFSGDARAVNARNGHHLGLGLFIVNEITRGHGGRVSVTSNAESGTVFSVVLPIDPEPDLAASGPA
ncbi:signal transduction histidine kinase [Tahibacter aquaticus]|uniref:histidine kinase n=1 Tax=Tahibacter aquaticus TaxID=520092 RepID=A0A4R6Z578_9GAMM|nr:sensor histidine kinase [Tahibacter aquaticus]TDR46804.1 signal transduction histidine kinase [Tahibacter aquaticus]